MELFLNATSPYARMVRVLLLERDLADSVTLKMCDPWADDEDLIKANPAARIPALVTDDGTTLSESLLIAYYLNGLGKAQPTLPNGDQLAGVLHLAGLGQSLMDAAFTTVISRKYLGEETNDSVLGQRRRRAIERILDQLESELNTSQLTTTLTLGDISVVVALEYLSFRLPEHHWQASRPMLADWHHAASARPSIQQTAFT